MQRLDVKYVFLDVVGYTTKTIEIQAKIVERLQDIVRSSVQAIFLMGFNVKYLPTGDGMCIVLEEEQKDDKHIVLALEILRRLDGHNKKGLNKFYVRIGINENKDIVYTDINYRRNYAGRGINYAQRAMTSASAMQIVVGPAVFEKLADTSLYHNKFAEFRTEIKGGNSITLYQLVDTAYPFLNSSLE